MFFKKKNRRIVILGIDGVPYSFLKSGTDEGKFKNIKMITTENGGLKKYNSVYPTVSSVAWSSYMTGKNPGEHSIFGFVDRSTQPFVLKIPLANDRTEKTLWKQASEKGKKVLVMNVPVTYPPEEVNGILISGFLTPGIEKVVYPSSYVGYLKQKGYIIDVDPRIGHTNRRRFMDELHRALDIRMEVFFDLLGKDDYFLAQCHIMETDRINHFFWGDYEDDGEFKGDFEKFYSKLDEWIGKTYSLLNNEDVFIVLSDHGFCRVKYNVQINHFLEEEGYLLWQTDDPDNITALSKDSIAYSLIPGRVFINLEGREEKGSVPVSKYGMVRQELKEKLLGLKSPKGEQIIERAFFREEIYSGAYIGNAADIIIHPKWGFDLKGNVNTGELCQKPGTIDGMHTYDDAVIFGRGIKLQEVNSIQDPLRILLGK
ncbi:alkaline phosphatase family protein [candidate division WOR-3 bacterium]|nr:alkaline phosphatase family protein [candidate division WOR-3 bacterium]